MSYTMKIDPNSKIDLADYPTDTTKDLDKNAALALLEPLKDELRDLQELLYAASQNSLLIVLQGMDTSGKDGTVRKVLGGIDPLGCRVWSFKQPTPLEAAHDFLWRVHAKTPEKGMMTVFNRSHYEDVLIVRVKELVPKAIWKKRYDQINEFERLLTDSGTIILKFFLHISKDEQKQRLLAREDDPVKAWKLSVADWTERQYWPDYQTAYAEALSRCSTHAAPWIVVPADHKWYRDLAIAQTIVDSLRPYRKQWLASLDELGKTQRAEIERFRQQTKSKAPS